MQKKLLAVAVAGVLAAPVAAMAQSSVTISGVFKVGVDQYKVSNRAGGNNNSEIRVTDNSSRIIFGMTEDMGGGTAGIAQVDMRAALDTGNLNAGGNTWVGLRGSSWGSLTLGRHDLHYGKQPDDIASKAGALMAAAVSIMDYTYRATAIAGATRTPNVIRYDSPNWSGFAFTAAYSTSGSPASEADLTSAIRKGWAANFNPSYTANNWAVGYSYWTQKADGGGTDANQQSNVLYGYWRGGGFKVGAAVNQSKTKSVSAAGVETDASDRKNYTIPVSWTSGSHNIYAHYTKAGKDKIGGDGTDAKMYAVAYVYDLSKRTSVGITYAKLDNNTNSMYNFFTNSSTSLGSAGSNLAAGEDGQLIQGTIRHAF